MLSPEKARALEALIRREWVSLKQAAPLLGLSYPTAMKYAEERRIDVIPVGTGYRVYADEIHRFLLFGNLPTDPDELERQRLVVAGALSPVASKPDIQAARDLLEPPPPPETEPDSET